MGDTHPDELDLLSYVEDDLPEATRRDVAEHAAACGDCRARLRELGTAREALRASRPLALPAHRRERLLRELEAREGRRRSGGAFPRLAGARAALAVAVGLVAAVATLDGGGEEAGEGGEAAREAPLEAQAERKSGGRGGAGGGGGKDDLELTAAPLAEVEGPARRVAARLRERGHEARVRDGEVIVSLRAGEREPLLRSLGTLAPGPVPVLAEPGG